MTLKIPYIGEITAHQITILVLLGMVMGALLTSNALSVYLQQFPQKDSLATESETLVEKKPVSVAYSKKISFCSALCSKPPEKEVIQKVVPKRSISAGTTRLVDLPKNPKNPNAIRISLAEAPTILAEVKKVGGKPTCAKKNDKGRMSKKTNSVHIDRECCLDPDEIPNPRCLYQ